MKLADEYCMRPGQSLGSIVSASMNPINVFRRLAVAEHYDYELVRPEEIHISLPGLWCQHDIVVAWHADTETIHFYLALDGRAPGGRSDDICRLLSLLNERLNVGHFDFWGKNGALVYRNALSLRGGARLKIEQAQDMIASALDAAERGYPACQYVIWAGKSPEDALTSALVDLAANP